MNMELWAATFLRFVALLHFYIFTVFSGRSIPAMAKVTVGLALSITVADQVDVSHIKTVWDVAAYAGTQIVIDYHFQKL